jgi:hypothetical protein
MIDRWWWLICLGTFLFGVSVRSLINDGHLHGGWMLTPIAIAILLVIRQERKRKSD